MSGNRPSPTKPIRSSRTRIPRSTGSTLSGRPAIGCQISDGTQESLIAAGLSRIPRKKSVCPARGPDGHGPAPSQANAMPPLRSIAGRQRWSRELMKGAAVGSARSDMQFVRCRRSRGSTGWHVESRSRARLVGAQNAGGSRSCQLGPRNPGATIVRITLLRMSVGLHHTLLSDKVGHQGLAELRRIQGHRPGNPRARDRANSPPRSANSWSICCSVIGWSLPGPPRHCPNAS